jgi:hypothetical protein
MTLAEYMRERVSVGGFESCWEWQGHRDRQGYGKVSGSRGGGFAHRAFYEMRRGPIARDLTLDHLCRNRACCNPSHLEAVTHTENVLRGLSPTAVNAQKTRCPNGHEYDSENTYITRAGKRHCRACHRERSRERQRRLRHAQATKGTGS